jgi:phosphoglycolate phosphatase
MRTMKKSAVIFDCDGVMFDSRQSNINFYNHLLSHFGLPPMTHVDIEYVHMHTAHESVNHIFKKSHHREEAQEYRLQLDYTPFIKDMVMEPGLKELLEFLKPYYGLAVATNRSTTIGKVLDLNELSHYFDIVISSLDVKNPKPHPEPVYKILDFFSAEPRGCFYVGDSEVDFEVCKATGVPLIAYKNRALEAEIHVESLGELKEVFRVRLKGSA